MTGRRRGSDHQNRLNSAGRHNAGNQPSNPGAAIVPEGPPPPDDVLDAEVGPSASAPLKTEWEEVHAAIIGSGFQVEQVLPPGVATINEFAKMGGKPGDLRTRLANLTAEQGE